MDQFRQIGEVLGSIKALMVLKHDIQINQKQCCLLLDIFTLAFDTIADEIKQNLKLEEKNTKWKPLEQPLRELYGIFREGELYIKNCIDIKDWWGKSVSFHQNKDCVGFHIHNLLSCFPIVIEAIEEASEISGLTTTGKYEDEWNDPKLFQRKFGKQYLVAREVCNRIENAWKEDKWSLIERLTSASFGKNERRLGEFLVKKLNGSEGALSIKLLPSSILIGTNDFHVKKRLGSMGSHHKEIHWMGENFGLRTFFGDKEQLNSEISLVLSLSHPNIMQHLCGFYDEEKKECLLVMELMHKNLSTYIKENCGQKKRVPFSTPVAVDIMLQIARGMDYLHSNNIRHGELNPSNILLKPRGSTTECYFWAKVKGFGLTSVKNFSRASSNQNEEDPVIWYAPEVLAEQEHSNSKCTNKYTEKADVYSFAMLCFQLLTGKVPFEDSHLQGDKMARNIRAGERPLFPHPFPKYLANLIRKCWQTNSFLRPSFSSICRILRYTKKALVINPTHGQPEAPPQLVDYYDLEAGFSKKFPEDGNFDLKTVSQIPFQMFAYRLVEKERISGGLKSSSDSANEDDFIDDLFMTASDRRSVCSEVFERKSSFQTMNDQRSVLSDAPQRKNSFNNDRRRVYFEIPEEKPTRTPSNAHDMKAVESETPEGKLQPKKPDEEKPNIAQIQEKKLQPTTVDRVTTLSEVLEEENRSAEKGDQEPKYPEEKEPVLEKTKTASQSSKCHETAEKEASSTAATVRRTNTSKKAENKTTLTRKLKESNSSKSLGTLKRESPSSSPTRILKGNASPRSTAGRTPKGYSSPSSSPARTFNNGCSSPARTFGNNCSSPARTFQSSCPSPSRTFHYCCSSPARTFHNGNSSPRASLLNPCSRSSKLSRENSLPSAMGPRKNLKGNNSD